MAFRNRNRNRRNRRRFGRTARGGRFNLKRLTPRRKRMIEKRRRRFFEEDLNFETIRRRNTTRALYSTHIRGKTKIYEQYEDDKTIIDVAKILMKNSNSG